MTIQFFAYIRDPDFAGCKQTAWPATENLRTLGHELGERYGNKFREEYFAPGETDFGERIIVMVNGRRAEFLQGLDTPLKDTDTVLIFPVVAGG